MKQRRIGLTLAKFAPMHIGHEALIEESLEIVDELYVLLYHCPDKTTVPLVVRAAWVKAAFPTDRVKVLLGYDAPNRHEDTPEVRRMQEEYLKRKLAGIPLTHFLSSEYYGEHVSAALGIANIVLDPEREKHGINATMIRCTPWQLRNKISPNVYFDLLHKIAILGDPATTSAVARELARHYRTLALTAGKLDFAQLPGRTELMANRSARQQHLLPETIYQARDYVFVSSGALTDKELEQNPKSLAFGKPSAVLNLEIHHPSTSSW